MQRGPSSLRPSRPPAGPPEPGRGDTGGGVGQAEILALKAWKECRDAAEALDPAKLADGIDAEERDTMRRECREARDHLGRILEALGEAV